jgi:hypothetical protein
MLDDNEDEVGHKHHDEEIVLDTGFHPTTGVVDVTKPKRKRESTLRKAPGAPKRFKSSYILFFMAHRDAIKNELGPQASVSTNEVC